MKWTKVHIFKSSFHHLRLLLLVLTITEQVKGAGPPNDDDSICDNGKLNIDLDLGGEENWKCVSNSTFTKPSYHKPPPVPTCSSADEFEVGRLVLSVLYFHFLQPKYRCMDETLQYGAHPPIVGDYRPVAPLYGDYEYLPPQRWLHTLKLGGVAFLYHPCAPHDQVTLLKHLAQSCLWKHVVTPYPYLPEDQPLALVSWGCSYHLEWVHQDSVKTWLRQNAMNTDQSLESTVGTYNEKLITKADEKLKAQSVCPTEDSPTLTISVDTGSTHPPEDDTESSHTHSESPCSSNAKSDGHSESSTTRHTGCNTMPTPLIVVNTSNGRVTVLIALALVILLLALLIILWRLWSNYCRQGRTKGRYKSVSKYFPMTTSVDSRTEGLVTIPEMGLPKDGFSEREKLLEGSDEDEL